MDNPSTFVSLPKEQIEDDYTNCHFYFKPICNIVSFIHNSSGELSDLLGEPVFQFKYHDDDCPIYPNNCNFCDDITCTATGVEECFNHRFPISEDDGYIFSPVCPDCLYQFLSSENSKIQITPRPSCECDEHFKQEYHHQHHLFYQIICQAIYHTNCCDDCGPHEFQEIVPSIDLLALAFDNVDRQLYWYISTLYTGFEFSKDRRSIDKEYIQLKDTIDKIKFPTFKSAGKK